MAGKSRNGLIQNGRGAKSQILLGQLRAGAGATAGGDDQGGNAHRVDLQSLGLTGRLFHTLTGRMAAIRDPCCRLRSMLQTPIVHNMRALF
jgi:hypothetical protein